jgi:hypothetical protein
MFRITLKVKIAAGVAAGALTLGAAAAYAAANANNTITVSPTPIALGSGTNPLKLIGFNGTTSLSLPAGGFKTAGDCVSFLAKNKNVALAPQASTTGSVQLSKNYHGRLMSGANTWCSAQLTSTATKTRSTASPSGASHGSGRASRQRTRPKPTN